MMNKGCASHLCDRNAEAIQMITAGMAAYRATRATLLCHSFCRTYH